MILIIRPFTVGDYIIETAEKNEGTVHDIDIFYTTLYTFDNKKIVVPNKKLTDSSVINVTAKGHRILDIKIGIGYKDDLKKAKEVMRKVCESDPAVRKDRDIVIYVDDLAESAVRLGVRVWLRTEDFWPSKWRITENIKLACDDAGINIAFNQLDVHLN